MSKPKEQHIISRTVLQNFSKNKEQLNKEVDLLGDRYVFSERNKKNDFAANSCYKIIKEDFYEKNDFYVKRQNILNVYSKDFCIRNLYTLDVNSYKNYLNKYGILNNKEDNEIRYILERDFQYSEKSFGDFIKNWNQYESNFLNFKSELINIISFIQSNELRAKNLYRDFCLEDLSDSFDSFIDYKLFDLSIFFIFLELYFDDIIECSDYYELVELMNYLTKIKLLSNNDLSKKLLAKLNNKDIKYNNIMLIKNSSNVSFLLSDIAAQTFYSNFIFFDEIIKILGEHNFIERPTKITIMPIKYNLLAIVTDVKLNSLHFNNENIEDIKKINSIICSNINEWLIVYDSTKKRNEIINEEFFNLIKKYERISDLLSWVKHSMFNESINSLKYGYKKIDEKDFILINNIINHLKNFIFYFKDEYYTLFKNLEEKQLNCLKLLFLKEDLCNEFTIDDINKIVIFYK